MSEFFVKLKKLNEINKNRLEKKCKYCYAPVIFKALTILTDSFGEEKIKWGCVNVMTGENHSITCLGTKDYVHKFKEGDVVISKWKRHNTIYVIDEVLKSEAKYSLRYHKGNNYASASTVIPIKVLDKISRKCSEDMINAIF